MRSFVKVHVSREEAYKVGREQHGTFEVPVDPALLLELRAWEREWLAGSLRDGLLPHGLKQGRWQHSSLRAEPLWPTDDWAVATRQVAELIRQRMDQCQQAKLRHELGIELLGGWLAKFRPELLHKFQGGLISEHQVLELRCASLLPPAGSHPALPKFLPLQDGDVESCGCRQRLVKFSSEPCEHLAHESQWSAIPPAQDAVADAVNGAAWVTHDEFDSEDLTFALRKHEAWCAACDPERQQATLRVGLVARLQWGPHQLAREYGLGRIGS
jgi:hypothetical protein